MERRIEPGDSAKARFDSLPPDAPRAAWFEALREAIAEFYLADPEDPYRGSGRSGGAARWEETRRCLVEPVHKSGDFLDVGCANGLLLECLVRWAEEQDHELRPHGIDFVPELIDLARDRFPGREEEFEVANAFYWRPHRRYVFVRTSVEYVPVADRVAFARRQHDLAVAPGGRFILCHYRNTGEEPVDPGEVLECAGLRPVGRTEAPGVLVAWCDRAAS
jgi:SAM-dependent methyltransferase